MSYKKVITKYISIVSFGFIGIGGAWAHDDFRYAQDLAQKWVINEKNTSEEYNLEKSISRAEISKVIINISGQNISSCQGNIFGDVNLIWGDLCSFIEAAANTGIISKNMYYRPAHSVTRAEAMKMILWAMNIPSENFKTSFQDIEHIGDLRGYIKAGVKYLIISDAQYFYPNREATRGDVFRFASKALSTSKWIEKWWWIWNWENTVELETENKESTSQSEQEHLKETLEIYGDLGEETWEESSDFGDVSSDVFDISGTTSFREYIRNNVLPLSDDVTYTEIFKDYGLADDASCSVDICFTGTTGNLSDYIAYDSPFHLDREVNNSSRRYALLTSLSSAFEITHVHSRNTLFLFDRSESMGSPFLNDIFLDPTGVFQKKEECKEYYSLYSKQCITKFQRDKELKSIRAWKEKSKHFLTTQAILDMIRDMNPSDMVRIVWIGEGKEIILPQTKVADVSLSALSEKIKNTTSEGTSNALEMLEAIPSMFENGTPEKQVVLLSDSLGSVVTEKEKILDQIKILENNWIHVILIDLEAQAGQDFALQVSSYKGVSYVGIEYAYELLRFAQDFQKYAVPLFTNMSLHIESDVIPEHIFSSEGEEAPLLKENIFEIGNTYENIHKQWYIQFQEVPQKVTLTLNYEKPDGSKKTFLKSYTTSDFSWASASALQKWGVVISYTHSLWMTLENADSSYIDNIRKHLTTYKHLFSKEELFQDEFKILDDLKSLLQEAHQGVFYKGRKRYPHLTIAF